jgi:hypothetical protein
MAKDKSKVRESKPLAETPEYDYDGSTLASKLKQIEVDAAKRRADSYAERKESNDRRREAMNERKQSGSGGALQGLNTSLGGKIVK